MPPLRRVSPHVWFLPALRGEPGPANAGLVSQLVVVDDAPSLWLLGAGPTPAFGRQLDALLRQHFGRGATDLVITRAAPTLALGSAGIAASRRWALDDVADAMAQRCGQCLQHLRQQLGGVGGMGDTLHPALIRLPTHRLRLNTGLSRRLGPFDIQARPRAAGERVLVLRHRADRVLIAQGLLWPGGVPDLREIDSSVMLATLQQLRRLAVGHQVLGEQGGAGSVADIDAQLGYVSRLRRAVDAAQAQGRHEAEPAPPSPGFMPHEDDARRHALNWQRVWREREALSLR